MNIENVIRALKVCGSGDSAHCKNCAYYQFGDECFRNLSVDACSYLEDFSNLSNCPVCGSDAVSTYCGEVISADCDDCGFSVSVPAPGEGRNFSAVSDLMHRVIKVWNAGAESNGGM